MIELGSEYYFIYKFHFLSEPRHSLASITWVRQERITTTHGENGSYNYQEALVTPGICPLYANSRKQTRQSLNLR